MSKIEATKQSLKGCLSGRFFRIPVYQRQYVWNKTCVEQFFDDIHDHYVRCQDETQDDYFIGSIITFEDKQEAVVIDGQQRLTTAIILLCAIRDVMGRFDLVFPAHASALLMDNASDTEGNDLRKPRLAVHYPDGSRFMTCLMDQSDPKKLPGNGASLENLTNAYSILSKRIESKLDLEDSEDQGSVLKKFILHIQERVTAIHVSTDSPSTCLKMFETINSRGMGLKSADLIKNLIFATAKPDEFKDIDKRWQILFDKFDQKTGRLLRYLREYMLSRFQIPELREDAVFSTFSHRDTMKTLMKDGLFCLLDDITTRADIANYIDSQRDFEGAKCERLRIIQYLGRTFGAIIRSCFVLHRFGQQTAKPGIHSFNVLKTS